MKLVRAIKDVMQNEYGSVYGSRNPLLAEESFETKITAINTATHTLTITRVAIPY